jgi:acyl-CoA reductase-like NAD-dependent aldehyde dehydrogenase
MHNPLTLDPTDPQYPDTSIETLNTYYQKSDQAQKIWQKLSFKTRSNLLLKYAYQIVEHRDQGALLLKQETGRPYSLNGLIELNNTPTYVLGAIQEAKVALKSVKPTLSPLDYPGKKIQVHAVPRGVIGVIAPWNYPLNTLLKSLIPALLSGNGVLVKPSEYVPHVTTWFIQMLMKILTEFNPDLKSLVCCVYGTKDVGEALIQCGIKGLVFTGSVPTGKRVAHLAAEALIPCSLELGGKDAALVLADANLERTALGLVQWSLFNSGQDCSSIERIFVDERIADDLVQRMTTIIHSMRVAHFETDDVELGPLQNQQQCDRVHTQIQDALQQGAQCLHGGEPTGQGYGYQPTLLDHCTPDMLIFQEETFGPVVAVCRFKDEEEALLWANQSQYGLNGSVWTQNLEKGQNLASRLEVGIALVNNHSITGSLPNVPWTGVKETGPGIAGSRWAYAPFIRRQVLVIDRNQDPDPFWFPVDESFKTFVELLALRHVKGGLFTLAKLGFLAKKRLKIIKKLLNP